MNEVPGGEDIRRREGIRGRETVRRREDVRGREGVRRVIDGWDGKVKGIKS